MLNENERVIRSGEHANPNFDATIVGWKIHYTNGTIVSSVDSDWNTAPSTDIVIVVLYYNQTHPIYINGVEEIRNYVVLLDEGEYVWRQIQNGIETFGQCIASDPSTPISTTPGEIKSFGQFDRQIWATANSMRVW